MSKLFAALGILLLLGAAASYEFSEPQSRLSTLSERAESMLDAENGISPDHFVERIRELCDEATARCSSIETWVAPAEGSTLSADTVEAQVGYSFQAAADGQLFGSASNVIKASRTITVPKTAVRYGAYPRDGATRQP